MWRVWCDIGSRLLDLVLPRQCYYCGRPLASVQPGGFCDRCWRSIRLITPPYCPCCGQPFQSPNVLASSPEYLCGACRAHPPYFDHARAIGHYEGPLRQAIHQLKYHGKLHLKQPLLHLALEHFEAHFPETHFEAIMPVPLHRERLMQREFNQATVFARGLAHELHIPMLEHLLVRTRSTRPQVELSGRQRHQNVRQAFAVTHAAALKDKCVLVVDDVLTTGATLGEIARTLKVAGARQVDVFALARVVQD